MGWGWEGLWGGCEVEELQKDATENVNGVKTQILNKSPTRRGEKKEIVFFFFFFLHI